MSTDDEISHEINIIDEPLMNKSSFTVINTSSRSLCPKIGSLIDCFSEMIATIGIGIGIGTET